MRRRNICAHERGQQLRQGMYQGERSVEGAEAEGRNPHLWLEALQLGLLGCHGVIPVAPRWNVLCDKRVVVCIVQNPSGSPRDLDSGHGGGGRGGRGGEGVQGEERG